MCSENVMLTLDKLGAMTGPQIVAYNREHPGELDALGVPDHADV